MSKIKSMTTQHIKNRIAWLERNKPDHWEIHGDNLPSGSYMRAAIDECIEMADKEIKQLSIELERRSDEI